MESNEDGIYVLYIYENIYGSFTIRSLENRFLISIDRSRHSKPQVVMHEQWRDMGRRIAKRANIEYESFSNKDISQLGNLDFKTLRGLSLKGINADLSTASILKSCLPDCFSEVKYLLPDECNLSLMEDCLLRCSPKKLSWLFIDGRDREQSITTLNDILRSFHEMRVLHLHMVMNIPRSIGNLKYLKMLEIHCGLLKDLPEEVGHLQELRILNLYGCRNLLNIPSGVGKLSKLEYLNLSECYRLQSMCDFEVGMESLRDLILEGTGRRDSSLVELKGLANLRMLQTLDLSGSSFRKCNLLGCLEMLSQLRRLFMRECHEDLLQEAAKAFRAQELRSAAFMELRLDIFPETSLPYCPDLIDLRVMNILNLQEWPDLFLNMPNLQVLHLLNYPSWSERCNYGWRERPMSFGNLLHLKELDFAGFGKLQEFPDSIKNLTQLEKFVIYTFPNLLRLPVCLKSFEHLRDVSIYNCPGQQALRGMPILHAI